MKQKRVRWLMDGEVPVETNVTFARIAFCALLFVMIVYVVWLMIEARSFVKVLVIVGPIFLIVAFLFRLVIWEMFTEFSQELFDELHGRSS